MDMSEEEKNRIHELTENILDACLGKCKEDQENSKFIFEALLMCQTTWALVVEHSYKDFKKSLLHTVYKYKKLKKKVHKEAALKR